MKQKRSYECKNDNLKAKKTLFTILTLFTIHYSLFTILSCSYVFSGGASGKVVDSESTANPKAGIADVDVYAYTSESDRDADYNRWSSSSRFSPSSSYYAHTTTDSDGNFRISKIVWETKKSTFGKDADISNVYLLFYHENYGLVKGGTLIVSDSTSDTVYQELLKIKTTTTVNLSFVDVSSGNPTANAVLATILVPQNGLGGAEGEKKYTATITGTGAVQISYPRYLTEDDKSNQKENEPEIKITYAQSSDNVTWKACCNGDGPTANNEDGTPNENGGYDFYTANPSFTKKISGASYSISLYGKTTVLSLPTISGRYDSTSSADGLGVPEDDGIVISMKAKGSGTEYTIDCGETTTAAENIGTSGTQSHGNFSGLGNGITWKDESYTGKYATTEVQITANGTVKKEMEVRSDTANYNVQIAEERPKEPETPEENDTPEENETPEEMEVQSDTANYNVQIN